ncbi:MAG: carboxypeptidase-like regulatory domain-containing protein [candidate division WOR-3 bacterium]
MCLFLYQGCYIDQPHEALLDPENRFGKSTVKILCYDYFHNPLPGVEVSINDTLSKITDGNGYVSFSNVLKGNLKIKFNKDGYSTFFIDTFLASGIPLELVEYLNFVPQIETSYVYSSVKRTYDILDSLRYDVNFIVKVLEKDSIDDISLASIKFDFGEFSFIKVYEGNFIKCSLNFNRLSSPLNIYDLIGENASIKIKDVYGESLIVKNLTLIRFVEYIPTIDYPYEAQQVDYPYIFKFRTDKPYYSSYINLSINDENDSIIFSDSFSIYDTLFVYEKILKEGEYRFNVRVYDLFGNFSENSVKFFSK